MLRCFSSTTKSPVSCAGSPGSHFDLLAFFQLGNDAVDLVILVGRLFAGAGNNQRRAGFVDQDGIHFVDDRVIVPALHAILDVELHVVAQVVEAELVVGAVGDVGRIGRAPLFIIQIVHDHADREAEEAVQPAHPFRVAFRQVIVDRDHVNAAPAERVEIYRKRSDQRLALAGLHFRDRALVQHHAADQLHVEMAHVEHAPSGLADHGKGLHQNLVEDFLKRFIFLFFKLLLLVKIGLVLGFQASTTSGCGRSCQPGSAAPECAAGIRPSWRAARRR